MTELSTHLASIAVKKRNGQEVPFFAVRIQRAIASAFKAHCGLPQESDLPEDLARSVEKITTQVVAGCETEAVDRKVLFIEDIQDTVIRTLAASGFPEIAQRYKDYRHLQQTERLEHQRITVRKRDGRTVSFKPEKITRAIAKAFAAELGEDLFPETAIEAALKVSDAVIQKVRALSADAFTVDIEKIQDLAELALMEQGFHDIAQRYIRYREDRRMARISGPSSLAAETSQPSLRLKKANGTVLPLDLALLRRIILDACFGFEDEVSPELILKAALRNCVDTMPEEKLIDAVALAVRPLIEKDTAYSYIAGRVLLKKLYEEVHGGPASKELIRGVYPELFRKAVVRGIEAERLSPAMQDYNLQKLGKALRMERDESFQFMGLQILYDRYFLHHDGVRFETPQIFWMRIAMGLALNEGKAKDDRAIEFYEVLSTFRFVSSTPTLFNAGTLHPQLSSCFLTTVADDLDHIFKSIKDNAMLSKWSGGLGNDWTSVRAMGARIKGTNGKSQGIIPFLKVANDTAVAVNQGGKRQGAVCAYLECWHLDFEEFLELRKNTGDDRRRTHDMHTASWIPDLFMKRVLANGDWTLFSPNEVPDLHDLTGTAFEERYRGYESAALAGKLRQSKRMPAVDLWRKILTMLFETGHPWVTFKDPSNIRSPQDHQGVVHSSNLCTEILLNTNRDETAVCNLGSLNLAAHMTSGGFDRTLLADTVGIAMRMLDNVIDLNYYPTPEARNSNLKHRPVGLGLMGFQDCLYRMGVSYASDEAVRFADESMEFISYHALLASTELARERGPYASFKGSKWDRGILPFDTLALLEKERGGYLEIDRSQTLDWTPVREAIRQHGMRNCNTMAIAPTATIAQIVGITQSIEPLYKHLFAKSNLSGEFTAINPYLVAELKALGIWDTGMIDDLKYFDGCLAEIARIPQSVKNRFPTAFEIDYEWIIECASRRQKWIDMGQSVNLYLAEASGKKLHSMYTLAWQKGLKTTYYLRSLGATRIEKSTLDAKKYKNTIGKKKFTPEQTAQCRLDNPDSCEACQ
ncbi:MAG: ribonucleoside-diphosphate reductase subunit alpha [Candidatus Omnitrophota bacterium]